MWYIYIIEYYTVIKKTKSFFAEKWMELETIMLREISQTHKDKNCRFSLILECMGKKDMEVKEGLSGM
jgi:hypothetical protein